MTSSAISTLSPTRAALPEAIEVRGARVHNLRGLDLEVPLHQLVGVAGVSGSGKSSLALGVLYAEGARRYLESLSTYTRRRMSQAARPDVDEVRHVPAAIALHQRPATPSIRSTFGTSTEVLNPLRLAFSRLGSHMCPNGHLNAPTMNVALEVPIECATCGVDFYGPGAEMMAFNSEGACPCCEGTGEVREINPDALIPDDSLTLREGAVASWNQFGITWMWNVAGALGVPVDTPVRELSQEHLDILLHGPEVKRLVSIPSKTGKLFDLNATYRNATRAVEEAMSKASSAKGLERLSRFLHVRTCPECHGSRLSAQVRSTQLTSAVQSPRGATLSLDVACELPLVDLLAWVGGLEEAAPEELTEVAHQIVGELQVIARRLIELGLSYLSLDRASLTLSTGERQRVQLARAVRNRTTGALYVLDEPTIGLHPANIDGVHGVMEDLLADGNSVLVVDHDAALLERADWLIEIGPGSGKHGGTVVANAPTREVMAQEDSLIAPYLTGEAPVRVRDVFPVDIDDPERTIRLETDAIHTVQPLAVAIPEGCLTAVTGVSGSGKTTLVLEALVPALVAMQSDAELPAPATSLATGTTQRAVVVDASPIGSNVRSTVATYSGILDVLRRLYARTDAARAAGLTASDFSYNTGSLRCPGCEGTGQVSLDVQFLPDVDIECPQCLGSRYAPQAADYRAMGGLSLPELLALTVEEVLEVARAERKVAKPLALLEDLGLGYLTLGEATTALSGGEAQRLKLSTYLGSRQEGTLFVLDEPSIGLHPHDVRTLLHVLDRLIDDGASVLVIEHDLDMIANADWIIDMGPGGGEAGGRVVASGPVEEIVASEESLTGRYLQAHLARGQEN